MSDLAPNRLLVGIDIGWSKRRRTCALALRGPADQRSGIAFGSNISVGVYTLEELLEELVRIVRAYPTLFESALVVIDGPVGPNIAPVPGRLLDGAFSRGGFARRAPAYALTHGSGVEMAQTTRRVLGALTDSVTAVRAWLGGPVPADVLVVAETNPTPAMALLLPQQEVASLPSRKHAKGLAGETIRAKSDWYWHLGGGAYAARILGQGAVAHEANHERRAALFALALAAGLARSPGAIAALGDQDGVYLVPAQVDQTWKADVERIGVAHGPVTFVAAQEAPPITATNVRPPLTPPAPRVTAPRTADMTIRVVMNDNGGLNVAANPWLSDVELPCVLCGPGGILLTVVSRFNRRSDMFRVEPSVLSVARSLGFEGAHLSKQTPVGFEAEQGGPPSPTTT